MEQSLGKSAGLSATCCTCSHCFKLLFFMFKILMLTCLHICTPFNDRAREGSDQKAAFPLVWFSGLHIRHCQSQLCSAPGSDVTPSLTVQTFGKADFPYLNFWQQICHLYSCKTKFYLCQMKNAHALQAAPSDCKYRLVSSKSIYRQSSPYWHYINEGPSSFSSSCHLKF